MIRWGCKFSTALSIISSNLRDFSINLSQREISIDNAYGKIIPFLPSQQVRHDSKKLNLSSYGFCFLSKTDFKISNKKS